jgi:hypothetical protein
MPRAQLLFWESHDKINLLLHAPFLFVYSCIIRYLRIPTRRFPLFQPGWRCVTFADARRLPEFQQQPPLPA